jgi:hypothetical protein
MTNIPSHIQLLRSTTSNKVPQLTDLLIGELGINTSSDTPSLYARTETGVVKIGPVYIAESYNSNPSLGELWFTPSTSILNVYNGSAWQTVGVSSGGTGSGGNSFTYTTPSPIPYTIGGFLAGSTLASASQTALWTSLLFPYVPPTALLNVTGITPSTGGFPLNPSQGQGYSSSGYNWFWDNTNGWTVQVEVGFTFSAAARQRLSITPTGVSAGITGNNTLSVNYQFDQIDITNSSIGGISSGTGSNTVAIYSRPALTSSVPETVTWTAVINGQDNIGRTSTSTVSISIGWAYQCFVGTGPSSVLHLINLNNQAASYTVPTSYTKPATSDAQYIYFFLPPGMTINNYYINGLKIGMIQQSSITEIRNGVSVVYQVYSTPNATYGTPIITTL